MPEEIVATPPVAEPQISLADHEAQFAPPNSFAEAVATAEPVATADEDDDEAAATAKPRHRAASQQAKPEDVATIAELTKRAHAAEKELGIERQPGESQRVFSLRKRVELAERLRGAPKPVATPAVAAPPAFTPPSPAPSNFAEPEPTQAQFMDHADPYGAFISAHTRWEIKKDQFDGQQTAAKTEQEQSLKASQEKFSGWVKKTEEDHTGRMLTYVEKNPAVKDEMNAAGALDISPIMYGAVTLSDRGPEIVLEYARHPELVDELLLQTAGRPLIQPDGSVNPLVAIVQRRVLSRLTVASTGSTPPRLVVPAPRPPNPVRTAPQTPSATPPGDGATLADHEAFYGPNKHRR